MRVKHAHICPWIVWCFLGCSDPAEMEILHDFTGFSRPYKNTFPELLLDQQSQFHCVTGCHTLGNSICLRCGSPLVLGRVPLRCAKPYSRDWHRIWPISARNVLWHFDAFCMGCARDQLMNRYDSLDGQTERDWEMYIDIDYRYVDVKIVFCWWPYGYIK